MLDLILRGGTIIDGSGLPGYTGDVGVAGGRIVSVGRPLGDGARVVDATGKVVAPGFIDPHTHYDAQVLLRPVRATRPSSTASPRSSPATARSAWRRCGAAHRDRFGRMFRLIEEMPAAAFEQGVDWRWGDSFDGMVDAVAADIALNVAPLVGHSVLRLYVLGDDARRPATADEIAADVRPPAGLPRRRRRRDVDELHRHRGGPAPGAVALGPPRRTAGAVRRARRARPHAAGRARVLRPGPDRDARRDAGRDLPHVRHPHDAVAALPQRRHPRWHRAGDGGSGARMADRRARLAAGADPAHRHQLDARPAQHHVPRHPRLVAGALADDPR